MSQWWLVQLARGVHKKTDLSSQNHFLETFLFMKQRIQWVCSPMVCACTKFKVSVYRINVSIWFKIHFIKILLEMNALYTYNYYAR